MYIVCRIVGVLTKHKNCDYSLNNEQNFTKFLLYAYLVRVHDISCDFVFELYVLLLIQNRTLPTLEFTPTAGAYLANVLVHGTSTI
jgi:hypothetical protein